MDSKMAAITMTKVNNATPLFNSLSGRCAKIAIMQQNYKFSKRKFGAGKEERYF
jgi:hypothetical protein